ncbi:L-seryl-tRNA selenium transferase [Campylobacter sputorum]|uniref:L-seryl-tRNA selenium transferase n=1 Tax=Campylobacter sputorum TaxID=206 RepID=UPI0012474FE5|nr:L-seryl-tRNA selenium transferase [Campylobacter sputorum]KAB0581978.1 L-seryl-tRNA selenium transferase [Campylobacter sputorum subsp. sputorum]
MKKNLLLIVFVCAFFISGCTTKRQYFEPENVTGEMKFTSQLSSEIVSTSINGAILEDGTVISLNGIEKNLKVSKDVSLLGHTNDTFIISKLNGEIYVIDNNGKTIFSKKFPVAIVSAATDGELLATLSSENDIQLININTNETLLDYKSSIAYAQDSRMAPPYFMSSLIIFPTLDGKIIVVEKQSGRIIRDVVVSNEPFFNNIIYLDVVGDRMFAATATKIIMISPTITTNHRGEIKNIKIYNNNVFIFEKDGNIIKADLDLRRIKSKDFPFAIFSNVAVKNGFLYALEKNGHIIKIDENLENSEIYKLDDEVENRSFVSKDGIYYDDRYLEIK